MAVFVLLPLEPPLSARHPPPDDWSGPRARGAVPHDELARPRPRSDPEDTDGVLGTAPDAGHLARLRPARGRARRGLGRLLVHGVPRGGRRPHQDARAEPGGEGGAGPRGQGTRGPGVRRPRLRRLVPVRPARRTAQDQTPPRLRGGRPGPARLADHLLLRASRPAPHGCGPGRARRRPARDHPAGRRHGGELPTGHRGCPGVRVLPAQRHGGAVREPGLQPRPAAGQEPLGGHPHGARPPETCRGPGPLPGTGPPPRRSPLRLTPAGSRPRAPRRSADAAPPPRAGPAAGAYGPASAGRSAPPGHARR